MNWSFSASKQFNACQRQWYYRTIVADGKVKHDAVRKEVTILSKLQTLKALRGSTVDYIISSKVMGSLNKGFSLRKDYYITEALSLFDKRILFAKLQQYREEGIKLSGNEEYAALYEYEMGEPITSRDMEGAKSDIVAALTNFVDNRELIDYLGSASFLMPQRPLNYSFSKFKVVGVPDLVAFFPSKPPHLFDWKVHSYGVNTYDDQLVSYAHALYQVNCTGPHKDFPKNLSDYPITDYRLSEYQLLHPDRIRRDYELTPEKLDEFKDYLSSSLIELMLTGGAKKYGEVPETNFDTTPYPEYCQNCAFKCICQR
jgi:hypothetical protein